MYRVADFRSPLQDQHCVTRRRYPLQSPRFLPFRCLRFPLPLRLQHSFNSDCLRHCQHFYQPYSSLLALFPSGSLGLSWLVIHSPFADCLPVARVAWLFAGISVVGVSAFRLGTCG